MNRNIIATVQTAAKNERAGIDYIGIKDADKAAEMLALGLIVAGNRGDEYHLTDKGRDVAGRFFPVRQIINGRPTITTPRIR